MIIAIDFDDTITEPSEYPIMGKIREEAISVIKELKKKHTLVLWTCRTDKYLEEALNALKEAGIEFDYINDYPGAGRKIFADVYVDDRAFNCIIDWKQIKRELVDEYREK